MYDCKPPKNLIAMPNLTHKRKENDNNNDKRNNNIKSSGPSARATGVVFSILE